jgi:hypothetical protein
MQRSAGAAMRRLPRQLGPVVFAAAVLAAILRKYPAADILAKLHEGNPLRVVPFAALLAVTFLLWGASADTVVLRRFGGVGWLDVARGKAATAVLTSIGYFFSNGGYAVWIARRTRLGASLSAGLALYVMMGDLGAVGLVASAVLPWVHESSPALRWIAFAIATVPVAAIILGPWVPGRVRLFDPWRAVPRWAGFTQLALRCINVAFAAVLTSLAARVFGLAIPFGTLLASTPILLLVTSLPVNVAGIGAAQAAWLVLFVRYEDGPKILAFQILWAVALGVAFVVRGLPFLPRVLDEVAGNRSPA